MTAAVPCAPVDEGIPLGVVLDFDVFNRQLTDAVLFGGSPARLLRLNGPAQRALAELRRAPVASAGARVLARRLIDGGLAHPKAGAPAGHLSVTVVIPVRDRPELLAHCLRSVGSSYPVLVVDDGSLDPPAVAAVCQRHGADLIVRAVNGGPGAARNDAIAALDTDLIAFLDSDCQPDPGWIAALSGHFRDPLVAAVAPRVVAAALPRDALPRDAQPRARAVDRYNQARSPLDLGSTAGRVEPMTRISYVPTAALIVRRAALGPARFDERLRFGEDVDLIWRMISADWRVRYDPSVHVRHVEPGTWRQLLRRRFDYGTSAAALSRRHRGLLAPLVLQPGPSLVVAAALARRPVAALLALAGGSALMARRIRQLQVPTAGTTRAVGAAAWQTGLGVGRWTTQFALLVPVAVAAFPGSGRASTRWGRRLSAAALVLVPVAVEWRQRRPAIDPVRYAAMVIIDQVAYGTGVWRGCWRERTLAPVRPVVRRGALSTRRNR